MTYMFVYTGLSWVVMGVMTFYVVRYAVKANQLVELLKGINANQ